MNSPAVLHFRQFLEKNDLDMQIFELFKHQLSGKGLLISKEKIVDASFIEASNSTKDFEKTRYRTVMPSAKTDSYYAYPQGKVRGIIHTVTSTQRMFRISVRLIN